MTEESPKTRAELEAQLIAKAWKDPAYQDELMHDTRGTIEREFHVTLPADLHIQVLAEEANTLYVVVPQPPEKMGELSDRDLEAVAGGEIAKAFAVGLSVGFSVGTVTASVGSSVGLATVSNLSGGW